MESLKTSLLVFLLFFGIGCDDHRAFEPVPTQSSAGGAGVFGGCSEAASCGTPNTEAQAEVAPNELEQAKAIIAAIAEARGLDVKLSGIGAADSTSFLSLNLQRRESTSGLADPGVFSTEEARANNVSGHQFGRISFVLSPYLGVDSASFVEVDTILSSQNKSHVILGNDSELLSKDILGVDDAGDPSIQFGELMEGAFPNLLVIAACDAYCVNTIVFVQITRSDEQTTHAVLAKYKNQAADSKIADGERRELHAMPQVFSTLANNHRIPDNYFQALIQKFVKKSATDDADEGSGLPGSGIDVE